MPKSKNQITVAIEGLNHSKHINALIRKGIFLLKVKREYKRLTLTFDSQYFREVKTYLEENCLDYRIIKYTGTSTVRSFLKEKFGFIFGVVSIIILLSFAFNLVVSVDYPETTKVDILNVRQILESSGYCPPVFKSKIDCKQIKEKISELPYVALTSVYIDGGVLHIEINEELEPEHIEKENYLPIVADRDCIIEQVIVESGTALVEKGQTVKKGDVLIAPYVVFNKDENITSPTQAIGKIYARVYLSETIEYNEYTVVSEYTGKEEKQRILVFADKLLSRVSETAFAEYDEEVVKMSFYSFPFEIIEIMRKEKVETARYMPFSDVKEALQQELTDKMTDYLKNNVQILNKWCIIKNISSTYTLTGIIEYVDSVGVIDESG